MLRNSKSYIPTTKSGSKKSEKYQIVAVVYMYGRRYGLVIQETDNRKEAEGIVMRLRAEYPDYEFRIIRKGSTVMPLI